MKLYLKIVWSNKWWLIPVSRITKDGNFIGYTNKIGKFTYRIKPVLKLKK